MDLDTCKTIGTMVNKEPHEIVGMELGQCVVARRGQGAVMAQRYPTLEDPVYQQYIAEEEVNDHEKSKQ